MTLGPGYDVGGSSRTSAQVRSDMAAAGVSPAVTSWMLQGVGVTGPGPEGAEGVVDRCLASAGGCPSVSMESVRGLYEIRRMGTSGPGGSEGYERNAMTRLTRRVDNPISAEDWAGLHEYTREIIVDLNWKGLRAEQWNEIADAIRGNPRATVSHLEALREIVRALPSSPDGHGADVRQTDSRRDARVDWLNERIADVRDAEEAQDAANAISELAAESEASAPYAP